jgi:hypothetical protein
MQEETSSMGGAALEAHVYWMEWYLIVFVELDDGRAGGAVCLWLWWGIRKVYRADKKLL